MFSSTSHTKTLAAPAALAALAALAAAAIIALALLAAPRTAAAQETQEAQPAPDLALTAQTQAKAVNAVVFSTIGSSSPALTKTVKKYDITGDGKADKIKFKIIKDRDGWGSAFKIYVNGKLRYTTKGMGGYGFYLNNVKVKYLRMKNGRPFLYIACNANNGDGAQEVLQYRSGKLKAMISRDKMPVGYGNHNQLTDAVASGNTVKATFMQMTYTAGAVPSTYTYKVKSGLLKIANTQTSSVGYYISGGSGYAQYYASARGSLQTYASPGSSKKAFVISAGQQIKLSKACMKSGKLYFRATTASGDSGWFESLKRGYGTYGSETLLVGTFMAG